MIFHDFRHTVHYVLNPFVLTFAAQVSLMWFTTKHNNRNAKYALVVGIPLRLKLKKKHGLQISILTNIFYRKNNLL